MTDRMRYERRHSRWYEALLLGWPFQLLFGGLLVIGLPGLERWGWGFWEYLPQVRSNTMLACGLAFVGILWTLRRLHRFPGVRVSAFIFPTVSVAYLLVVAVLFFTREEYTRQVLFGSYLVSLAWFYLAFFLGRRYRRMKLAIVPVGKVANLNPTSQIELRQLEGPDLAGVRFDGVVADLRAGELSAEWEKFLARCTLAHIPVYHVRQIRESITGRVEITHLSENEFGSLLPNSFYAGFKRLMDVVAVLVTFPFTLPLMLATAIAVKLDSPGPVLFKQQRVGQGDRDYTIYKFRSMCTDSEKDGARLAQSGDSRVTRVGKFIRKTRLDELPQFFNVLKGDMSLIGPRPEQRAFVEQFEKEIPFYIYRHVVKPGISGWAQVVQGYASDTDDTRIKIQHDFYYIKHFSLWLDVLIVFKTLKTIFTGFGAK